MEPEISLPRLAPGSDPVDEQAPSSDDFQVVTPSPSAPDPLAYWQRSRTPWSSLVFLLPILIGYEVGVVMYADSAGHLARSGADYWMRMALGNGSLAGAILPLLVVCGLLVWQWRSRLDWKTEPGVLKGMLAESLLFAIGLVLIGRLQHQLFVALSVPPPLATDGHQLIASDAGPRVVCYLGAGIYEEFFFRLLLLPLCYFGLRRFLRPNFAGTAAVILSSGVFAAAHYLGPVGDQFDAFTFTFRLTAGLLFSTLFLLRGFGVTVGCHAIYDLLVGVLRIG